MVVALLGFGRFGKALGSLLGEAQIQYRALDPRVDVPAPVRAPGLRELVAGASVVVLAVPVPRTREALESLRPHLLPEQVVLDVGSVKVHPYADLQAVLGDAIPWVATHPLFGPVSLALAERPLRVVVCPSPRHPAAAVRAGELYRRIGCEVIEQTPEGHDRVMAHTHALTFFVAKGMLDAGAGMEVPFAPPSFQAISRTIETVRSDAGHLFAAIQRENPFAHEARHQLLQALVEIDRALEATPAEAGPESARFAIPDLGARSPELQEARELIDDVDRELLSLLARRATLAQRAGKAKAQLGHPIVDPARETRLLAERRDWAESLHLDPEVVEELFRSILRFSRRAQRSEAREGGEPSGR
ncbi:MAG TPA: prephenate dehydrogenase/arogenate dehydrogenase family protein [Myxococcaceae bacterium]|nr:prephenate dehydrogenase/arogenate dehydrogenase family protein [Myxococcaceae bacterium]